MRNKRDAISHYTVDELPFATHCMGTVSFNVKRVVNMYSRAKMSVSKILPHTLAFPDLVIYMYAFILYRNIVSLLIKCITGISHSISLASDLKMDSDSFDIVAWVEVYI